MRDYQSMIGAKAFRVIPAEAYHQVLAEVSIRERAPLVYEVVVPEAGPWEGFRERVYPPFARYLKTRGIDPEAPRGVVVSAFLGSRCFLLEGPAFVEVLREMEGLNASALHFRVLRWLAG